MRWGLVVAIASFAQAARADAPREHAAVAAVDVAPTLPAYVQAKATAQIEEGLAAAGYDVIPSAQVAATLTPELASCREGACVRQVGDKLDVQSLVFASIASKGESSIIDLRVYDVATGVQLADVHEVCDLCGDAELNERVGVAASALRARVVEARDKQARAVTPPPPPPPPQHVDVERPGSIVPGVAVGAAGALALGAGIYLLAIDGHGTCNASDTPVFPDPGAVIRFPDPNDHSHFVCRDIYQTRTPGIVAAVVGVAAVGAGVALVWRARHHHETVEVQPTGGGASVRATWSW